MQFDLGHINKVTAIHVMLNGDERTYHFLGMKMSKGEIQFTKTGSKITDEQALLKAIGKTNPVLLHFSGKGILNRAVTLQENYRQSILLNSNIDAFYFSDFIEGQKVFSSVIRKDAVDGVLNWFATEKIQVISISSGPFYTGILQPVLKVDELAIGGVQLSFEQDKLTDFSKSSLSENELNREAVQLGEDRLSLNLLPCAAVGAVFFNPTDKVAFPDNEAVFETNKEEARQKNIFARFGMGMMLLFLAVLFVNYLYLGQLNQTVMDNAVYLADYEEQLSAIADLEEERLRKERLLQSSGLLNKNFLSYYLMQISNSVPSKIIFDEIVLRPLEDDIKQRQKIAFHEHLVLISGRSETSQVLSLWIEKIERQEWLEKVDIMSYEYIKNEGVFEIEMHVY